MKILIVIILRAVGLNDLYNLLFTGLFLQYTLVICIIQKVQKNIKDTEWTN